MQNDYLNNKRKYDSSSDLIFKESAENTLSNQYHNIEIATRDFLATFSSWLMVVQLHTPDEHLILWISDCTFQPLDE